MKKKFHAWNSHGIRKSLNNHGKSWIFVKKFSETTSSQKTRCQTHKLPVARKLAVRHTSFVCLTAIFLATGGFSKFIHCLQACLFKYITVAAFHIYALHGEDAVKGRGWRSCIKSHGNYIFDHGKIMEFCF